MKRFRDICASVATHGKISEKCRDGYEVKFICQIFTQSMHYLNVHRQRRPDPEHIITVLEPVVEQY